MYKQKGLLPLVTFIGNCRAGASQPSRSAGTIFLYISLPFQIRNVSLMVIRVRMCWCTPRANVSFCCGSPMDAECPTANMQPTWMRSVLQPTCNLHGCGVSYSQHATYMDAECPTANMQKYTSRWGYPIRQFSLCS